MKETRANMTQVTVEEMREILKSKDEELELMKETYATAHARLERLAVQLDKYAKRAQAEAKK